MITNRFRNSLIVLVFTFTLFNCNKKENINPQIPLESSKKFQKLFQTKDSIFTLNSAVQLIDSSYTIAGAVRYNGTGDYNVLMKFDKYGNRKWTKIMKNSYTPDGIEKLFQNNKGYIGYRGHHYNVSNSSHILFFNENGDVESEIFKNRDMVGNDMIRDGNNFLIAGRKSGMHFRMLNQNGELIWEKSYDIFLPEASSISKLTDGNFISIGGGNDSDSGNFLVKLSETGEEVWSKNKKGLSVLAIPNYEFLAVTYTGFANSEKGNLVRFDHEGNIIWTKELIDFGTTHLKPSPLCIINYDMKFFICTYVDKNHNLKILVLNQNGNEIHLHTIEDYDNTGDEYTLVSKTMDNGLLIAYTGFLYNFGLIKLSNEFLFN